MDRFAGVVVTVWLTTFGWVIPGEAMEFLAPQGAPPRPGFLPNTGFGEEFGQVPNAIRSGTSFLAAYEFKDRDEGNTMWVEKVALYARDENGIWFVYDETPTWAPCSFPVSLDRWTLISTVDLTHPRLDGYTVGDRIDFRWYAKFRDGGCLNLVEKNQYFQAIKAEPFPLYPNQKSATMHSHAGFTDNIGEYGSVYALIALARTLGLDIYVWTDHLYDFTPEECESLGLQAAELSSGTFIVIAGGEGNLDGNETNENPDNPLHTGTNRCIRTPSEIPGVDVFSTTLMTLAAFRDNVAARGGSWYATHPFARPFVPEQPGQLTQWSDANVDLALGDPRFIGFQIWNRGRTSTIRDVTDLNNINPYPWTADPNADDELFASLARLDAIQQQHLTPLRRVVPLAGTDDHGAFGYDLRRETDLDIVVDNNALGTCFTVAEMSTFSEAAFWPALQLGRTYMSNGPGCRLGVDRDGNGTLETTLGDINQTAQGGTIRLTGQSNGEFGPFTRGTLYRFTATTRDSVVQNLSGMAATMIMPVSWIGGGSAFVRAKLETAGGYGDHAGLVLTAPIYFNTTPVSVPETPPTAEHRVAVYPNPSASSVTFGWDGGPAPSEVLICDVTGRIVAQLVPSPGVSDARWQADAVPNGVYYARLTFPGGNVATQKFLVVR